MTDTENENTEPEARSSRIVLSQLQVVVLADAIRDNTGCVNAELQHFVYPEGVDDAEIAATMEFPCNAGHVKRLREELGIELVELHHKDARIAKLEDDLAVVVREVEELTGRQEAILNIITTLQQANEAIQELLKTEPDVTTDNMEFKGEPDDYDDVPGIAERQTSDDDT